MLLDYYKALRLQRQAERAPHLAFTVPNVPALLEQVRGTLFPTISDRLEVFFIDGPFVACICHSPLSGATIFLHNILNRPEVSPAVFQYILSHELIHLIVRGREVEGKFTTHPPEFWEMERALVPNRDVAFSWLWLSFSPVLKRDKEHEGIRVKRRWRRAPELIHVWAWEEFQDKCDRLDAREATL
jgi:hypothetical protein